MVVDPCKIRSAPCVLIVSLLESDKLFATVKSLVADPKVKLEPLAFSVTTLIGAVAESVILSVNETLVVSLLFQVSATFKLPPRLMVLSAVLNTDPVANVALP